MTKRARLIRNIRRIALLGLFLFSVKLLTTGLVLPVLHKYDVIKTEKTEVSVTFDIIKKETGNSCSTGGCNSPTKISFLNIIFGLLAGYWFIKEMKQTLKFGLYTSGGPNDLQWGLISILFLLPGFYILAICAVILSFVKPGLYAEWYAKIINS